MEKKRPDEMEMAKKKDEKGKKEKEKEIKGRIDKYYKLTAEALKKAKEAPENLNFELARQDFLDMVERYLKDAMHFKEKKQLLNAFAALNYAHGWLDAGARIGLWEVHDSKLFTVDDKE